METYHEAVCDKRLGNIDELPRKPNTGGILERRNAHCEFDEVESARDAASDEDAEIARYMLPRI